MFSTIKKLSIYLLVGLLPLFWLPFSVEALEFNKGYLLAALVAVGILAWVGEMIFQRKELCFKRTPLDVYVLGFMAVMVLSAVFSVDKWPSILGVYGRFWPSLMGILSLGGFYFLVTNSVGERGDRPRPELGRINNGLGVVGVFLVSCAVAVVTVFLSLFGVWQRLPFKVPLVLAQPGFNMATPTLRGLAVFLSGVAVLLITLLALVRQSASGKQQPARSRQLPAALAKYVLLGLIMVVLALVDFWASWVVLIVSLACFLGFSLVKRVFREDVNRLSLAILVLLVSAVFLVSDPLAVLGQRAPFINNMPREVVLPQGLSWRVALSEVKESPVLGAGLSNFHYVFNKFKPGSFLKTDFWQIRFNRPGSYLAERLATTGVLGVLAWLALIGMFGMVSWLVLCQLAAKRGGLVGPGGESQPPGSAASSAQLQPQPPARRSSQSGGGLAPGSGSEGEGQGMSRLLVLVLAVVALVVAQVVYYQTVVLAFSFWLFLGLAVIAWQKPVKEKTYSFSRFPEIGLLFSIGFWALLLLALFSGFYLAKFYWADTYYKAYIQDPGSDEGLSKIQQASQLAPQRAVYHLALVGGLLNRFQGLVGEPEPDRTRISSIVATTVQEARQTAEKFLAWVAAQETAAMVYREIQGVANGAREWAQKRFAEALKLEPANPVLLTELGKVCLPVQGVATTTLQLGEDDPCAGGARQFFAKALDLRPGYVDAGVQMAFLHERADDLDQAVSQLRATVAQNPNSIEALFQLGRLLYNQGQYQEAAALFEQVIAIFPTHSNSLYSLALTYQRLGNEDKALELFERVLKLNPGNANIEENIQALKQGTAQQQESIKQGGMIGGMIESGPKAEPEPKPGP